MADRFSIRCRLRKFELIDNVIFLAVLRTVNAYAKRRELFRYILHTCKFSTTKVISTINYAYPILTFVSLKKKQTFKCIVFCTRAI